MDNEREKFLRNEFLTLSLFGALGRSKSYANSASKKDKDQFRNALRENLDKISQAYVSEIKEEKHLSNIKYLADDLTLRFPHCLRKGKFRIGIAQKALNLYLKYLWCAGLIEIPPHCPFDSIIINHLPDCENLKWTSIDTIEDYQKLVVAARKKANEKPLAQWELEIWTNSIKIARDDAKPKVSHRNKKKGESSKGFRETSARFHDDLKQAMLGYSGETLRTSQIKSIVMSSPDMTEHAQWIYPSDHCINHWNEGACYCALTDEAIFEKIRHGIYRVRKIA